MGWRIKGTGTEGRYDLRHAMQHIVYEARALERMQERGISKEEVVVETMSNPDDQRPARLRRQPCTSSLRRFGNRVCKVYTRTSSEPPVVATVAWHGE